MRCTMGDESNSIRGMAPDGWEVLESLPEIEFRRTGVEGWEALRRQAIGMAWAREGSAPYLAERDCSASGWSVAVFADLMR
jgi:hypothetical protein